MTVRVTEQGVWIPRELLRGVTSVEIERKGNAIVVTPSVEPDPIQNLGNQPLTLSETDVSENHDQYIYGK